MMAIKDINSSNHWVVWAQLEHRCLVVLEPTNQAGPPRTVTADVTFNVNLEDGTMQVKEFKNCQEVVG
jgi:hypothetical protein